MSVDNPDGPDTDLLLTQDQGIDLELYKSSSNMIVTNLLVNDAIFHLVTGDSTKYLENHISPMYQ
jgi:hypothetical protein